MPTPFDIRYRRSHTPASATAVATLPTPYPQPQRTDMVISTYQVYVCFVTRRKVLRLLTTPYWPTQITLPHQPSLHTMFAETVDNGTLVICRGTEAMNKKSPKGALVVGISI